MHVQKRQTSVVIIRPLGDSQICREAIDDCIRNVRPVDKSQKIEHAEDGDQAKINLRDELPLLALAQLAFV